MVYFPLRTLQSADPETDRVRAGTPLRIRFGRGKKEGVPPNVDFLSVDEGLYSDGVWTPGRRLNGDEYGVSLGDLPCMRRVKWYRHP